MSKYESEFSKGLAKRLFLEELQECQYFPKYFTIETCNNCNAHCIMCPKGLKGTENLQIMNQEIFERIVKHLETYSDWIEMICLNSDGEPLLDKEIVSRIHRLKEIGIKHVNISTNGQLLSEKKIYELLNSGLDDIRISIDGFYKKTYESIRCGLDYEAVVQNTKNLIEIRDKMNSDTSIKIRMVELEENKNEREEWMRYWSSLANKKYDKVQIMPMHTWSGTVREEENEKINYYSNRPCVSVFSSFAINYNGDVQLCDSDINQEMIMGNIMEQSIEQIWRSENFENVRTWHAEGKRNQINICRGCDHWDREFRES